MHNFVTVKNNGVLCIKIKSKGDLTTESQQVTSGTFVQAQANKNHGLLTVGMVVEREMAKAVPSCLVTKQRV